MPGSSPRSRMFQVAGRAMKTWNVQVGCEFNCTYCSARQLALTRLKDSPRYREGFIPHLIPEEAGRRFKPGSFVFVGYMGDISFAESHHIRLLLSEIAEQPKVDFLFCTKNPLMYSEHIKWPANLYLGSTIETTHNYYLTRAPSPLSRYLAMFTLTHPKKFISIEPICDFDLETMLQWMARIKPAIIEVGADNYGHELPEPPWEKVELLLKGLREICPMVVEKTGLERLKK